MKALNWLSMLTHQKVLETANGVWVQQSHDVMKSYGIAIYSSYIPCFAELVDRDAVVFVFVDSVAKKLNLDNHHNEISFQSIYVTKASLISFKTWVLFALTLNVHTWIKHSSAKVFFYSVQALPVFVPSWDGNCVIHAPFQIYVMIRLSRVPLSLPFLGFFFIFITLQYPYWYCICLDGTFPVVRCFPLEETAFPIYCDIDYRRSIWWAWKERKKWEWSP